VARHLSITIFLLGPFLHVGGVLAWEGAGDAATDTVSDFLPDYFYLFRGDRLDGPVSIFLGHLSHKRHRTVNGFI
jgi:hypothetical protein